MIQLSILPTDRKQRIDDLKRSQAVTGYLTLIGICLFLSVSFIFGTNFYLSNQLAQVNEQLSTVQSNGKRISLTEVNEMIATRFRQLQPFSSLKVSPVTSLSTLLRATPGGVVITKVTFSEKDKRYVVEGIARDRNTFLEFRQSLEQLDFVQNIQAPISNLSRPTTIPFTITASLKLSEER